MPAGRAWARPPRTRPASRTGPSGNGECCQMQSIGWTNTRSGPEIRGRGTGRCLMEQCAGVCRTESDELPLERLEAEICELAGHLWAATCRWLVLLGEFDRREGWSAWGIKSCAHWLSWRCGVSL